MEDANKEDEEIVVKAEELDRILKNAADTEDGDDEEEVFLLFRFLRTVRDKIREVESRIERDFNEEDQRIKEELRKVANLFRKSKK